MSDEAMENRQNYGADNIQVLEGLEAVRKRPAMLLGSIPIGKIILSTGDGLLKFGSLKVPPAPVLNLYPITSNRVA